MHDEILPTETLERLSRQEGVDVRPILVRVLTDLFVQKPHHAPAEIARYEELALQLLDVVGAETRAIVARKLSEDERAPDAVIARLLDDDVSVARPLLTRCAKVPRQTLLAVALDGSAAAAAAVAQRSDIDDDMVRILAHHPDDLVLEALAANAAVRPFEPTLAGLVARGRRQPSLAAALLRRDDFDAAALAPLYLAAEPDRRSDIRAALAARAQRPAGGRRSPSPNPDNVATVEAATLSGDRARLAETIGEALDLSPATAARLATEPSGEPFVMMLRAIGLDRDATARAILTAQPEIAQSVARFFALVEVADATPRAVALDLIAALTGAGPVSTAMPRHEPLFDPSGAPERAGAARAARRPRRTAALPGELSGRRGA